MKRREFTKRIILGGVGVALLPTWKLFAATNKSVVQLPQTVGHIRHGYLATNAGVSISNWLKAFTKNVFYANGITQNAKEDIHHLAFVLNQTPIDVLIKNKQATIAANGVTAKHSLYANKVTPLLNQQSGTIQIVQLKPQKKQQLLGKKENVLVVLKGKVKAGEQEVNANQALVIDNKSLKLKSTSNSLALYISTN